MSSHLNNWKNIVWSIRNDWCGWGTGFLVKREFSLGSGITGVRFFLVTQILYKIGGVPKVVAPAPYQLR